MKPFVKYLAIQLLFIYSTLMLGALAIFVRLTSVRQQSVSNRVFYRTDRIGDLIIGSDLVQASDQVVYRERTLPCNLEIEMPKILVSPLYAYRQMKRIFSMGDRIFIPVTAKTPDMLVIPLMFPKGARVGVKDSGTNFFAAPYISRNVFGVTLFDYGNEYENVRMWQESREMGFSLEIQRYSRALIFAPYGSSVKKSLTRNDIVKIATSACKEYDQVYMITNDDYHNVGGELEELNPNFRSLAGAHANIAEVVRFLDGKDADCISVDSAPAHLFAKNKSLNHQLTVFSSSAVINRFDIPCATTIRQECPHSGCNWVCRYGDFRCLNFERFDVSIIQAPGDKL